MLADSRMRLVQQTDVFPNLHNNMVQSQILPLDLAYYPKERGMYNYDMSNTMNDDGTFTDPENRWGGIMRALTTNDFELTNIEFIQFWMLNPFNDDAENVDTNSFHNGGDLYFNLGNISEDILSDSRKVIKWLPADGIPVNDNLDTTAWSRCQQIRSLLMHLIPILCQEKIRMLVLTDGTMLMKRFILKPIKTG